jgi:hypothetical protein
MATTVTTKYLWPPNYAGTPPTNQPGWKRVRVQLTGVQTDGTGETDVKKIDISTLLRSDGQAVVRTAVERIEYDAFGFTSIVLEWDRTSNETIAVLAGNNSGVLDYSKSGGLAESSDGWGFL